MRSVLVLLVTILIGGTGSVAADQFGDPVAGRLYAKETCTPCHSISAEDPVSPVIEATDFVTVANTPGMTRTALTVFLGTPHPTMPNLVLEPQDKDDVIAYILSLKEE